MTEYGDSLFQAPQFHELCKQGFFVSKVLWTAVETEAAGRKFEFEAEFKNAETGSGLPAFDRASRRPAQG